MIVCSHAWCTSLQVHVVVLAYYYTSLELLYISMNRGRGLLIATQ